MRKYFVSKIHVWGGLGSQLFAVALAYDLTKRFFRIKPTLILHTSGVTKRQSEMELFTQDFQILEIDDFATGETSEIGPNVNTLRIRTLVKQVLIALRVLGLENSSLESRQVKPWTLIYRGHYSYRFISKETTLKIASRLGITTNATEDLLYSSGRQVVVHYRLGDLLTLSSKGPISVDRLSLQIKKVCDSLGTNTFLVYSDDSPLARSLLTNSLPDYHAIPCSGTTIETLKRISESSCFIGTNSKISIWGTILRHYLNPSSQTWLPTEFFKQTESNLGPNHTVIFYE